MQNNITIFHVVLSILHMDDSSVIVDAENDENFDNEDGGDTTETNKVNVVGVD